MNLLMLSIGLNDEEKKEIFTKDDSFLEYNEIYGLKNIELLRGIGCSNRSIKEIVVSNPWFLNNLPDDTKELVKYLHDFLKVRDFNDLFHSNPLLLSKEKFEIEEFVKTEEDSGKSLKNIKDDLISF